MEITIDVFTQDSLDSIKSRVASQLDSLTKYIHILEERDAILQQRRNKRITLHVTNILSLLKDTRLNFKNFFTSEIQEIIKTNKLDLTNEIYKPWIYYRVNPEGIDSDYLPAMLLGEEGNMGVSLTFVNYVDDRMTFLKTLDESIQANNLKNRDFILQAVAQSQVQGRPFTEFEEEKVGYLFETNVKDLSIYEIFNHIILTNSIPFARLNGYYKIVKDYIPNLEWISQPYVNNTILLKVSNDVDVYFVVENDVLKLTFEYTRTKGGKIRKFLDNVLLIIGHLNPEIEKQSEISVNGVFYIPKEYLNTYVFSHLVLNDARFSNIYINESSKATKQKEGVYLYYNNGQEIISAVITAKKAFIYDPAIRDKSRELFPEGKYYLSVKVSRAKNLDSVREFQENISKIITLYNESYDEVVAFYQRFIKDFGKKENTKEDISDEEKFRKIDPELFSSSYTRKCTKRPAIISEEDAKKFKNVMLYPKTPEEGEQRYYTCEKRTDKHQFIGLQNFKESKAYSTCDSDLQEDTKQKYKYVPCCFTQNQAEKQNTPYRIYFEGQQKTTKSGQQKIIKTDKFVGYNRYGYLSAFKKIEKFFESINERDDMHYLRFGVDIGRLSFLQCVFEGMGQPYHNQNDRIGEIERLANVIASDENLLSVARQEFPDKSIEQIRNCLLGKNNYMNPRSYCSVLEVFFDCKIFIFSSENFELPLFLKNYICRNERKDCVIVLEHIGSESDASVYPQCELIVYANKEVASDVKYKFNPRDEISIIMWQVFEAFKQSYYLNKVVKDFVKDDFNIVGQCIDSYGKTKIIFIQDEKNRRYKLYSRNPIPPLPVTEIVRDIIENPSINDIKDLFGIFTKVKKIVKNEHITGFELHTKNKNIYYTPVEPTQDNDIYNFDSSDVNFIFPYSTESGIRIYNENKKIARYLSEHILYMFSKYLHSNNLNISEESIASFIKTHTTIIQDHNYGIIPKKFEVNNQGVIQGNKLVVNSLEVLRRLVYVIRLEISRNLYGVLEYYKKKNIEKYIEDISDFQTHQNQVLLYGKESIEKYITERNATFEISDVINFSMKTPYFFRNENVNEKVYLACNLNSIEEVYITINNWEKRRVNTLLPQDNARISSGIYNYINGNTINYIKGSREKSLVLAYRKRDEDAIHYTALLNL